MPKRLPRSSLLFNPLPTVLRQLRKDRKMTQEQVGDKVGVKQGTISSWEKGYTRPSPDQEAAFAAAVHGNAKEIGGYFYEVLRKRFGFDGSPVKQERRSREVEELLDQNVEHLTKKQVRLLRKRIVELEDLERGVWRTAWTIEESIESEIEANRSKKEEG